MTGYPRWAIARIQAPLVHAILRGDDTFGPQTRELALAQERVLIAARRRDVYAQRRRVGL